MKAIFDKNSYLVGWIDLDTKYVFDCNMMWIGFIHDDSFFDKRAEWIGGFISHTFVDKQGKPVAGVDGERIQGTTKLNKPIRPIVPNKPVRPVHPITPIRPIRQPVPIGGWSMMSWESYVNDIL